MARASMREELLALFRNTERTARASSGMHAVAGELRLNATSQSTYLRRFLQQGARSPSLAASGLAGLDDRLDGGFGPGLHLVLGPPGAGKTAFLDSVAWEAVCRERPVLYYTLREGGLGTWERLITALGHILGGPTVSLKAFRAHALAPEELRTVSRLDLAWQTAVLPYLSLVETVPSYADTLSALIDDIRLQAREAAERHGKIPLLLIDDLDRLLQVTRARPLPLLLSRLDSVLTADLMPGLLAATARDRSARSLEELPVQTELALEPVSASAGDDLEHIDLQVRSHARGGWTGTLPLLLDRCSGLFAQASA